ncbi:MAG: AAA family ATPase [Gammaproteobacteria bacterium]
MRIVPSPFTNRTTITAPEDFVGREEELAAILGRLRTLQSSSIVGERRIGKSSLLYQLAQTGREKLGDASYRFCYLDLQDARYHTANGFFRTTLSKLEVAPDAISETNTRNRNLLAFTDALESFAQSGQRLVLCLDEFEMSFKHPDEFDEDSLDHLRAQLNQRHFAFVTATQKPLQALCFEGKLTSPFYNVFTVTELGEFSEEEAQQFIRTHQDRVGFGDAELDFIWQHLDRHPLRLQILCDWVLQNRQRRLDDKALAEAVAREYKSFFVGGLDPRQLRRVRRLMSLNNVKRLVEVLKQVLGLFKGSDK